MKLVVVLEGGLITSVVTDDLKKEIDVITVDYDVDWVDDEDEVNIVDIEGNKAHVYSELTVEHDPSFVAKMSNLLK